MLNRGLLQCHACQSPHGFTPADDAGRAASADRLFFAVRPPPVATPGISRLAWHLRDKHRLTATPLRPECFHVTLLFAGFYGQIPPKTLEALAAAAGTVAMRRFRVGFDWVASFRRRGERPLVLRGDDGVTGLVWLRDRLVAAATGVPGGVPATRSSFTPHLTLLYDAREVREEPVEEIGWPVTEFVLIRSLFGQARHVVLRRWPLRG
ncbi:MAG TPA: 2'-5' RNA ligase family protein [Stellaceae bacterium]|nr:2'-5' RNA ligase family protein [Stellaceae bacterium]